MVSLTLEIRIETYDFDRLCESENDFWSVLVYMLDINVWYIKIILSCLCIFIQTEIFPKSVSILYKSRARLNRPTAHG